MPVLLTVRPAAEEIVMIRPQPRFFMPGITARLHRNAVVRLASTTSPQFWSVTSSIGWPTCPATPPALLTRMSTSPTAAKNSRTATGSLKSALSLSTPCTVAPSSLSAAAIAVPMPCATPVTTAVLPASPGVMTTSYRRTLATAQLTPNRSARSQGGHISLHSSSRAGRPQNYNSLLSRPYGAAMQHTRTIRYSLTTAMALAAIVASTAPAALAAPATRPATATAVAGYIWSDDGAATPDSYYAYNSTGGSVTQTSPASREYEIDFGGRGSIASTSVVQVPTYDDEFNCDVAGWGPSSGAGTDLLASVSCYTLAGTLATTGDIVFDLVVTHAVSPPHRVFAYAFVNKDNSSGNLVAYQYNSSRKKNSVKHLSKGHYQVTLAGPSSKIGR